MTDIETDIRYLQLKCEACTHYFVRVNDATCPRCNRVASIDGCKLTSEELNEVINDIEQFGHYLGEEEEDYDAEQERVTHVLIKDHLVNYRWWWFDRPQLQMVCKLISERPCPFPGYYNCALRYLKATYVDAYHFERY